MTSEEIVRHWRQSKRKLADLTVLAELNQSDRESIRKVLEEAGEILQPPRKPPRRMDQELARQLYDAGMTDEAMAGRLDVKPSTVGTWRRQNGLTANAPPAEAPPESAAPAVWERTGAILAALPEHLSAETRRQAKELLLGLFGEYLEEVLPDGGKA